MSGARTTDVEFGIREWLGELTVGSPAPAVATFDTRVKTPRLPGSAAKAAARLARRLRLDVRDRESFFVGDQDGPLLDGELDRAADWARGLVHDLDD
ncbi:hypothetical protein [Pseudolysinimonas yzui]|uniref:Uncharacterized protein n=1 Tax=Pseudolysinimonas yzui TaxID=2708254 RepID=A0A8J3GSJ5_9MICO|nr:hypothetical protein [Pseudolysinimonas yzui]GHF23487.1 hypothetical protein GCM10011600_25760 [Pseudolysinimonas yzui]